MVKGQIPRGLLIFAGVVVAVVVIVFLIIKIVSGPPEPAGTQGEEGEGTTTEQETYQPIYETAINGIKFTFQKIENKGNILRGSESKYPERQKDLTSKERFIAVTIGAQNIGKETIDKGQWDIGEIIDGAGRKFEFLEREVEPWLPEENNCGASLKPAFSPTLCTKIYEIAKVSTNLKIKVFVGEKGIITGRQEDVIDLKPY